MKIHENVSLAGHSTMRLGGAARYMAEASTEEEVEELAKWAKDKQLPIITIGRGSNIVWKDEGFEGLVIVNKLMGRHVMDEDEDTVTLKLAAGENWDQAVAWTVEQNLTGIEYMSLIPGTVGGAPVQNVGAYGGELSETLVEVDTYDTAQDCFMGIMNSSCEFSYRNSRFKSHDHGRFIITAIVLKLKKANPEPPFYESLRKYLDDNKITEFTPQTIRQAVIAIRQSKLPDPEKVANNGSFFKNPIVEPAKFEDLKQKFPDIVGWDTKNGKKKLAAGWLLEHAGLKDFHDAETGMATYDKQALVLVNENAKTTADLLAFRLKIVEKIQQTFGVTLEQEPELLP